MEEAQKALKLSNNDFSVKDKDKADDLLNSRIQKRLIDL